MRWYGGTVTVGIPGCLYSLISIPAYKSGMLRGMWYYGLVVYCGLVVLSGCSVRLYGTTVQYGGMGGHPLRSGYPFLLVQYSGKVVGTIRKVGIRHGGAVEYSGAIAQPTHVLHTTCGS